MGIVECPDLDERNLLPLLRLLSNVISENAQGLEKKRRLLSGLSEIIDAEYWVWSLFDDTDARQAPTCIDLLEGKPDRGHSSAPIYAPSSSDSPSATPSIFSKLQHHAFSLRTHQQALVQNGHVTCDANVLISEDGKVPCILSRKVATTNPVSIIGFYRSPGQPPFSPRKLRVADIVLTEVPWLHEQHWPAAAVSTRPLPPRQRQTLNLLIHGHSRNEIAHRLRISVHTVGDYIKALYTHFGVQSRAELMRRFPVGSLTNPDS